MTSPAAITAGLLATLFIGGAARVFVHEMIQVSGGPEGHGWYEWLMNGSVLLVGLLLGAWLGVARFKGRAAVLTVLNTFLAVPSVVVGLVAVVGLVVGLVVPPLQFLMKNWKQLLVICELQLMHFKEL